MSLIDQIESLQKKPPHVRQRVMMIAVSICMTLVIGVWLMSLQYTLTLSSTTSQQNSVVSHVETPFGLLWSNVKGSLKGAISAIHQ